MGIFPDDILLITIGLLYQSFKLYLSYKDVHDENRKVKNRATKNLLTLLMYFTVLTFYILVTMILNPIFGVLYNIVRGAVLLLLVVFNSKYSQNIFNIVLKFLKKSFPFAIEFSKRVVSNETAIGQNFQFVTNHLIDLFEHEYNKILSNIQINYEKIE